jgi:hypothetical protein
MFSAVLNNGSIWVAGGSTSLAYSTTGKTWTTVVSGPTNVNSIVWTGTLWISSSDGSNNLYTSHDAITWKLNTSLNAYNIYKIVYTNNILFALSAGTILYCPGLNFGAWSSHSVAGAGNFTGFVYTGTHYLFSSGTTLVSTQDLATWTTSSLPSASTALSINNSSSGAATVKPITIACCDSSYNTLGYSYDGIQWHGSGNTVLQTRANHAAWNGTRWVAVGKSANTWFAVSRDGTSWQQQPDSLFTEAYAVAWNGSLWIAAGEGSTYSLAYSLDGVQWTGVANSKSQLFVNRATDVKWNGLVWTACGSPTAVASSVDGISWTATSGVVGDLSSVLLSAPSFVASASSGANPGNVFDLSDGTVWTSQSSAYNPTTGLPVSSDGEYVQIQFVSNSYTVKQYYLRSTATDWSLYGSNDGISWSLIDDKTGITNNVFFSTTNTTPYSYYRVVFQKIVAGPTSVQANSVDFFVEQALSPYFKFNNTKRWLSSVVNTGYSLTTQFNGVLSPAATSQVALSTSFSYDGQYNLYTDLSNTNVYFGTDFSNGTLTAVSLPTIAKKYTSCFNGTYFFVGGSGPSSGTGSIMYAHPSDMSSWYSVDATFASGSVLALVSNSGLGFVSPPNTIYMNPGEKLSIVAPKFYDENMEKRGATFNFSLG